MQADEIYQNLFLCLVGMKEFDKAIKVLKEEFCDLASEDSILKIALKIIESYENKFSTNLTFNLPTTTKN